MAPGPTDAVTLLEWTHDGGVAAVCRADDFSELWLTADRGSEDWVDLEDYDLCIAGGDELVALAGRAPPKANAAEVRDAFGAVQSARSAEGVWLLVIPPAPGMELATVRFRDASGAIVALPQPPDARADPIPDATSSCPACDGTEWDLVTRTEARPEQVIACRSCGYSPIPYPGPEPSPPEVPDELRQPLRRAGRAAGAVARFALAKWSEWSLARLDFPLYGLGPTWIGARSVAGFSTAALLQPFAVELLHGDPDAGAGTAVIVETIRNTDERVPPGALAEDMLEREVEALLPERAQEPPASLSDPARGLWLEMAERQREVELARRVKSASRRTISDPSRGSDSRLPDLGKRTSVGRGSGDRGA